MSTKSKTENKTASTLMRKTKAQLVEIILRKDNIEHGLRDDIKSKDEIIDKYKDELTESIHKIDTVKGMYETLNAEFEKSCDEAASTICELREVIMNNHKVIFRLWIGIIISVIGAVCALCL